MKRLISYSANGIINSAVLQQFGIKCREGSHIADPDSNLAIFIKLSMAQSVKEKYPSVDRESAKMFVACVLRYIMHLQPELALYLTHRVKNCSEHRCTVDNIRNPLVTFYSRSGLPNVPLLIVITEQTLDALEKIMLSAA